jgi:predicted nucleic acid-binding protein
MTLVLDASAAGAIALGRAEAGPLRQAVADADWVIAPELFASEVPNVFWKYARSRASSPEECTQALATALDLPDDLIPMKAQAAECFAEAMRAGHPVYDLMYVVLARRHGALLATLDGKLAGLARKLAVRTVG